jgi:hypothetical protein
MRFKEARRSVLEPYAGYSPYPRHGQRVQRLMQAASDPFLGWMARAIADRRHFYVHQLRDAKIKFVVELMKILYLKNYARLCRWAAARAHARSGHTVLLSGSWAIAIGSIEFMTEGAIAVQGNERSPCPRSPTRSPIQLPAPRTTRQVPGCRERQRLCTDGKRWTSAAIRAVSVRNGAEP